MPNPTPKKRNCAYCGGSYFFQNNKTEYCTDACRLRAWRERKREEKESGDQKVLNRANEQTARDAKRKRKKK